MYNLFTITLIDPRVMDCDYCPMNHYFAEWVIRRAISFYKLDKRLFIGEDGLQKQQPKVVERTPVWFVGRQTLEPDRPYFFKYLDSPSRSDRITSIHTIYSNTQGASDQAIHWP